MIERVAYLSMHTSPLLQPGSGYAGGMNVYIDELARVMAGRNVGVTVYTRRTSPDQGNIVEVAPGYNVVHITAGPEAPVAMSDMESLVGEFTEGVLKAVYMNNDRFDLVHSHYWLSGWSGVLIKEALSVPLANSFHTLGRVKDLSRRPGSAPSSAMRLLTEQEVIAQSDCVIASTPYEFEDLLDHYGAQPERLCTSPPGIDHEVFSPGDREEARRWLGLGDEPIILFAGRIQPLKGIDVAVRALPSIESSGGPDPELVIVGGPSGEDGEQELAHLMELAATLGISDRVHRIAPQPHDQLALFYRAADALVMPSRSESFGLVAAEAQACGLPVAAASVGGLPYVVKHGESGLLVEGHDPADYAAALSTILADGTRGGRFAAGAIANSQQFSWPATANRLLELYAGITGA
jgi:D-inositol-3-phosphate glycosyltransferase